MGAAGRESRGLQGLTALPLQLQEEEHKGQNLQAGRTRQEAEKQGLQEQLQQQAAQLEGTRRSHEQAQMQLQQQAAEVSPIPRRGILGGPCCSADH